MRGESILCRGCETDFGFAVPFHRCPDCEGPLSFSLDRSFPPAEIAARPPGMWRYREALPAFQEAISLGEQATPLVPVAPREFGREGVLFKCEYTLPTGSYKDRGAATLVSYLKSVGVKEAVEDSSGNAGASMAAYCARAGIGLKVFCPQSASEGKLTQIRLYGAELVRVPGPRPRATEALVEHVEATGSAYASHLWHPLFLEGIRTMAYEIAEQLGWAAPDYVLCPVGAGSILLGLFGGFSDLLAAGAIARLPRLVAVQAANVAAVCDAVRTGAGRVEPARDPQPTLAEGIALPAPVRDREVLHAIRASGGTAVSVVEEEIAAGAVSLGKAGFCVEPTSAVVWNGLRKLTESHSPPPPGATIVAVLSGHGLKASPALAEILA